MEYRIVVESTLDDGSASARLVSLPVTAEQVARVVPGLLAEVLGAESVSVTTNDGPQESSTSSDKPARTRRTKAQIEADKAAAELAEQQRASAAAQPGGPAPQVPMASGGVLPGDPVASAVGTVATAAPAAPYDPFAVKS